MYRNQKESAKCYRLTVRAVTAEKKKAAYCEILYAQW